MKRTCTAIFLNEKQRHHQEPLNRIGLLSLTNQRLAKIVCTIFKAVNYDHAPKSIDFRNTKYDLTDIQKPPKANTTTYGLKSWRYLAP